MKKFITITLAFIIALSIPLAVYATTYVGNRNSWKFHYQGCQWERKMNESNRIYFSSRQEAIDRGMLPAKYVILKKYIIVLITKTPHN